MGEKRVRFAVNAGPVLPWIGYVGEQAAQAALGENWGVIPWIEIAAVSTALWAGFHLNEFYHGSHRLQRWWQDRRRMLRLSEPMMRIEEGHAYRFAAEVCFDRQARNAVLKVETFKEVRTATGKVWRRICQEDVLDRPECNAGQSKEFALIQVNAAPRPVQEGNALNALALALPSPPPAPEAGFYRVRVTATAANMRPHIRAYDFEWRDNMLRVLPLLPGAADYAEDTLGVQSGIETLWIRT